MKRRILAGAFLVFFVLFSTVVYAATKEWAGFSFTIPDFWEFGTDPYYLEFRLRQDPTHVYGLFNVSAVMYGSSREAAEGSRASKVQDGDSCDEVFDLMIGVNQIPTSGFYCFDTHPADGREMATLHYYAVWGETEIWISITGPRNEFAAGSWLLNNVDYIKNNLRAY